MQESPVEDRDQKTPEEIGIERMSMDIDDYEKALALALKIIDETIYRLKVSNGRFERDYLRTLVQNTSDAKELAIAMSPIGDYTQVKTNTFNCRTCKKVVWDDGSGTRYCHACIRSTHQTGPSEVSQGNSDQTS